MIIDFGLAELNPAYIQKLSDSIQKMKETHDPKLKLMEEKHKIYGRLADCLKTIGNNKIGT
jgi:hypothetical protein